jgi:hypothetical protein
VETIYGIVTSGTNWRFLRLHGETAQADMRDYYLSEIDKILGILVYMMASD